MRVHGTLAKWNDERGFGFVVLPHSHEEVFVHISAFPRDGVRPRIGETISFEIGTGSDGRKRAEAVRRPGARKRSVRNHDAPRRFKRSPLSPALAVAAVVGIGAAGYNFYTSHRSIDDRSFEDSAVEVTDRLFTCDGRKKCSQMTSCEEAKYFLRHCPGTTMDGDGDGVPCERQWCN